MAKEFYGFFDSVTGDERDYNQDDLSRGFRVVCDTGVATLEGDNLKVFPADSGLRTRVGYGAALIQGFVYELLDDGGAPMTLDHTLVVGQPRIDRVVLRLDLGSGARRVTLEIVRGEEAASPVPPALTRAGTIYEISLAQCRIRPGATLFADTDITDERADDSLCGNIRHVVTLAELGAALAVHKHAAADITSGIFPPERGGTGQTSLQATRNAMGLGNTTGAVPILNGGSGQTTNPSMLINLASTAAANVFAASPRPGVTGILPIANGGTGLAAAPSMLTRLDSTAAASPLLASPRPGITGALLVANGGFGVDMSSTANKITGFANTGLRIARGTTTFMAAVGTSSAGVAFPNGRFSAAPTVIAIPITSLPNYFKVTVSASSADSVILYVHSTYSAATSISIYWLAVQTNWT